MVDYLPHLTAHGVQHAYDPSVPCAPPPRPCTPTYSAHIDRPVSPTYAAYSDEDDLEDYGVSFPTYKPSAATSFSPSPAAAAAVAAAAVPESVVDSGHKCISHVAFTIRSAEEIVKLSAVEVKTSLVTHNGRAVEHGLRDARFGPSAGQPCGTCGATTSRPCNGHFGHYNLSAPLYNVHFIKQTILWLRLTCPACGELQIDCLPPKREHLGVLSVKKHDKKCRKCEESLQFSMLWSRERQVVVLRNDDVITAQQAMDRFKKVPLDHALFKKHTRLPHPRKLITTVLFVPSVCLRPCVGGKKNQAPRGENDLTHRLIKIISADELLRKKKEKHSNDLISLRAALLGLQEAYTGYLDATKTSKSANSDHGHQPKYKSTSDLLRGKEGLFRGNLCGKRVNYAARAVIAPSFDGAHPTMVGVPKWICKIMTVPERVFQHNRQHLQQLVDKKQVKYLEKEGEKVNLETHPHVGRLQVGWVVHRELRQGDVVLFNRQPTLSKKSVLALRVNELDTSLRVFRVPLQLTPGYNADFDGDEMNLHVPQSLEARAECYSLLGAHNSVINSSNGSASVVPVQGDRLGTYLMTDKRRTLTRNQWFACLCKCNETMLQRALRNPPTVFPTPASRLWSLALPDSYNWTNGNKTVKIVNGVLVQGQMNKKLVTLLVKDIALDISPTASLDFLQGVNIACGVYNGNVSPTTITFQEVCPSEELTLKCSAAVEKAYARSKKAGVDVSECIQQATRVVSAHVYAEQNRLQTKGMKNLVDSGSKGSPVNACMINGVLGKMLGEEQLQGVFTPPEDNPNGERRCFTTSEGSDAFMDSYVPRGFSRGMNLQQYAKHATAGRSAMIASSQLVGVTGYMFRRLTTALESCSSNAGCVIDTSTNSVVSFRYGGDGRSPFVVEKETLRIPVASFGVPSTDEMDAQLDKHVSAILALFPDAMTKMFDVPVSIRRILFDAKHRQFDSNDFVVCESVEQMMQKHVKYARNDFMLHWVCVHMHPYALEGLSDRAVAWSIQEIDRRMWKSRLEDGETVGHLCSSSLSAAATQFTLNSFHNVGASGGSYQGLEETINLNKTRRNPLTCFRLNESAGSIEEWVRKHKRITLKDVVLERSAPKKADDAVLETYWEFPDELTPFDAKMRLEVHCEDPFAVRMALEKAGVRHCAYAATNSGSFIYHTDITIPTSALDIVVSGDIENCTFEGSTVYCKRVKNVEAYSEDIDMSTYYTNNFHETAKTLGVEAARNTMVRELKRMLKTFGVQMQSRHVELLADRCCSTGRLLGCTRHGIQKSNPSRIFHSSAFEQHTHVLSVAAAAGGVDKLKGPQERQVLGQTSNIGTHNPWMELINDKNAQPVVCQSAATDDFMEVEDELNFVDDWIPQQSLPAAMQHDPWVPQSVH